MYASAKTIAQYFKLNYLAGCIFKQSVMPRIDYEASPRGFQRNACDQ
jgi:hypothetical protein